MPLPLTQEGYRPGYNGAPYPKPGYNGAPYPKPGPGPYPRPGYNGAPYPKPGYHGAPHPKPGPYKPGYGGDKPGYKHDQEYYSNGEPKYDGKYSEKYDQKYSEKYDGKHSEKYNSKYSKKEEQYGEKYTEKKEKVSTASNCTAASWVEHYRGPSSTVFIGLCMCIHVHMHAVSVCCIPRSMQHVSVVQKAQQGFQPHFNSCMSPYGPHRSALLLLPSVLPHAQHDEEKKYNEEKQYNDKKEDQKYDEYEPGKGKRYPEEYKPSEDKEEYDSKDKKVSGDVLTLSTDDAICLALVLVTA